MDHHSLTSKSRRSLMLVDSSLPGRRDAAMNVISKAEILEGICRHALARWRHLSLDNQNALGLDTTTAESVRERELQSISWLLMEAASMAAGQAVRSRKSRLDTADH